MGTHLIVLIERYPIILKPCHKGIHLSVLIERYPINTNMTRFGWFSKLFASFYFGRKVASALRGLRINNEKFQVSYFLPGVWLGRSQHICREHDKDFYVV